jgi:ABC-2 type transport system permease protein
VSDALRAEWTKLRTQTTTLWLLIATGVATVAISAAAGASTHQTGFVHGGDAVRLSLVGVYLGQIVIASLAVTTLSEEYATGVIKVTLAAMPRRLTLLTAKAATVCTLTVIVSAGTVGSCLLIGRVMLPADGVDPAHGYALVSLSSSATLRAASGTIIYLTLIALLSLGLAAVIRDTAVSIGVVVAPLYLPPLLAQIVGGTLARDIKQFAPMTAGLAIQHTTNLRALPIQPVAGLAVTAGWATAAILFGGLVLQRRDA